MMKTAYQRLLGSSSSVNEDELSPSAAPRTTNYGSTTIPPQQDTAAVPESIRIRRSFNRRQQSWRVIRSSIISLGNESSLGTTTATTPPITDLVDIAESVFSDIRSENASSQQALSNEAELYGLCTAYQRAFPERSFALFITLLLELPTLFMISGGSDRLCTLIGRRKYTVLISLLPIISAVSC